MAKLTMTRRDLVNLTVKQLRDEAQAAVDAAWIKDQAAEKAFREAVILAAQENQTTHLAVDQALTAVGSGLERLDASVNYGLDLSLDEPASTAEVVFRDGAPHDCRMMLRVRIDCPKAELQAWVDARRALLVAEERLALVSGSDAEARAIMIEEALAELPEGQAVLDAIAAFRKAVKS